MKNEDLGSSAIIKLAFQQIMHSQECIKKVYNQWNAPSCNETKILYDEMVKIVKNDDKITSEYHGLNAIFVGASKSGD